MLYLFAGKLVMFSNTISRHLIKPDFSGYRQCYSVGLLYFLSRNYANRYLNRNYCGHSSACYERPYGRPTCFQLLKVNEFMHLYIFRWNVYSTSLFGKHSIWIQSDQDLHIFVWLNNNTEISYTCRQQPMKYSKTCLKQPLKNKQIKGIKDKW